MRGTFVTIPLSEANLPFIKNRKFLCIPMDDTELEELRRGLLAQTAFIRQARRECAAQIQLLESADVENMAAEAEMTGLMHNVKIAAAVSDRMLELIGRGVLVAAEGAQ